MFIHNARRPLRISMCSERNIRASECYYEREVTSTPIAEPVSAMGTLVLALAVMLFLHVERRDVVARGNRGRRERAHTHNKKRKALRKCFGGTGSFMAPDSGILTTSSTHVNCYRRGACVSPLLLNNDAQFQPTVHMTMLSLSDYDP